MSDPATTSAATVGGALDGGRPTWVSVLDNALQRVSALDFEVPNPFVNHAPMACEALAVLGCDSLIDTWVETFESSMRLAVQPVLPNWNARFDWEDLLGDYRLVPEWMGYFGRAIDDQGWAGVVRTWVPRLMPGLVAALFHGVIRTAHAVRAIEVADTPARRAELARALGNWAGWFGPGQPADDPSVGDQRSAVLEAAAAGAHCYSTAPTIFNLHGVTGAMAVHLLVGHLSPDDAAPAASQLRAEHQALYRGITPMAPDNRHSLEWDDEVVAVASTSYDPHQIKLVEACRRGFEGTGNDGFVLAARTVTGALG